MKNRRALCAVVALTAFIAAGDLLLAVEWSDEPATQNTAVRASELTNWLLEHQRLISTAKLVVSTLHAALVASRDKLAALASDWPTPRSVAG